MDSPLASVDSFFALMESVRGGEGDPVRPLGAVPGGSPWGAPGHKATCPLGVVLRVSLGKKLSGEHTKKEIERERDEQRYFHNKFLCIATALLKPLPTVYMNAAFPQLGGNL